MPPAHPLDRDEPLLAPEPNRATLLPLRHPGIWRWYKKLEAMHWVATDVDMSADRRDWDTKLSDADRRFYKHILGFFGVADEEVLENLDENFTREVKLKEAQYFYRAQAAQEGVHSEAYSIQIDTILPPEEKEEVFDAVRKMPAVGRMRDWIARWGDAEKHPFGVRLVAFAIVEGLKFSGMFASIQQLKERNVLPGLTGFNELIVRDEGWHFLFAAYLLLEHVVHKPTADRAHEIVRSSIATVDAFFADALAGPGGVPGITADTMRQYVRFQADAVASALGYPAIYRVENPYPEMDKLSLNEIARTDFFEHRSSQYQVAVSSLALKFAICTDEPAL